MGSKSTHLVEDSAKIASYFFLDADLLLKEIDITHHEVLVTVKDTLFQGVFLCKTWDDCLMDLETNLFLDLATDWLYYFLRKGSVDLFLVVVDSDIWLLEMFNVPDHLKWIIEGHQEIVELVWALDIRHDHVEDEWEQ